MQVSVGAGTYVVAVSGGVDSMVLLDLLMKKYGAQSTESRAKNALSPQPSALSPNHKFIVAHFDHGIRDNSAEDRKLVQHIAKSHKLPFVHKNGRLGPNTSSAQARKARYDFLHQTLQASNARAIITAHHQDDLLETAILNLLRGTGRRGLTSLKSSDIIIRPLLGYTKSHLKEYAASRSLAWREDPSNNTDRYTRNYIRHHILPKFSEGHKAQMLILIKDLQMLNEEADRHIVNMLHSQPGLSMLNRRWFINLPHDISKEVAHAWLQRHNIRNLNRKTIERLIVQMKTGRPGVFADIDRQYILNISKDLLALKHRDRYH